jgi:hypothetical protein
MPRLTPADLDALEAAHRSNTPGQMRTIVDMGGVSVAVDGGYSHAHFTWAKDAEFYALAHNALPALIAEVRELRRKDEHMRRFAASMVDDGHPVLLGFAYQIQVILDALPMPEAPDA